MISLNDNIQFAFLYEFDITNIISHISALMKDDIEMLREYIVLKIHGNIH